MEAMEFWHFCDELTVVQAALLIIDQDPTVLAGSIGGLAKEDRPPGYEPVITALQYSIMSGRLEALKFSYGSGHVDSSIDSVDWYSTRIRVTDLKAWLEGKGVITGFFFPKDRVAAEYLDPANPCFAPKLAAAVQAWDAVSSARGQTHSPRSVKADLTRWLNLHAAEYGLANEEGEPNKLAVEEVAKVANWNPKGGAPRTPGGAADESVS